MLRLLRLRTEGGVRRYKLLNHISVLGDGTEWGGEEPPQADQEGGEETKQGNYFK